MESSKMVLMNLFAGRQWRCRHRDLWTHWGKERAGHTERTAWKHVHYHVRNSQRGSAETQREQTSALWQGRGWGGWEVRGRLKREGTDVYLWLIPVVWQKPTQHCKAIILQLKIKISKRLASKCMDKERWKNKEMKEFPSPKSFQNKVQIVQFYTQIPYLDSNSHPLCRYNKLIYLSSVSITALQIDSSVPSF